MVSAKKKRGERIDAVQTFLNDCDSQFKLVRKDGKGLHWYSVKTSEFRKIRGLLKPLRQIFYPNHRIIRRHCRSSSSKAIGRLVDQQMDAYVRNGCAKISGEKLHPFTEYIITTLEEHEMKLLATQVPLLDSESNIFTLIDAVGVEKTTGKSFLLDFKTGYDKGWTYGQNKIPSLPASVKDSPKNQHMLQIAWEHAVSETYYKMKFDTAYLMLANRNLGCCRRVEIAKWARAHATTIMHHMQSKIFKRKKTSR